MLLGKFAAPFCVKILFTKLGIKDRFYSILWWFMPRIDYRLGNTLAQRMLRNKSGLALIEFAFSLPIFIGLGFYGVEVANLAISQMKVSQITLNIADNASRIGSMNSQLGAKQVMESHINDVFQAADIQAGRYNLFGQGRTVLSSLEMNADGGQTIMWQRCKGELGEDSNYGEEDIGKNGKGFTGMGPAAERIAAIPGVAIMYVETFYEYEPLFEEMFMEARTLRQEAAYIVRDQRQIATKPIGDTSELRTSTCDKYDSILPQTPDPKPGDENKCTKRIHKDHYHWECPKGVQKPKETKQEKEKNECDLKLIICINGVKAPKTKAGDDDDDD